jgi:hypothetical protein
MRSVKWQAKNRDSAHHKIHFAKPDLCGLTSTEAHPRSIGNNGRWIEGGTWITSTTTPYGQGIHRRVEMLEAGTFSGLLPRSLPASTPSDWQPTTVTLSGLIHLEWVDRPVWALQVTSGHRGPAGRGRLGSDRSDHLPQQCQPLSSCRQGPQVLEPEAGLAGAWGAGGA